MALTKIVNGKSVEMSEDEELAHLAQQEQDSLKKAQEKSERQMAILKKAQEKKSCIDKLKKLGLTQEEIEALTN